MSRRAVVSFLLCLLAACHRPTDRGTIAVSLIEPAETGKAAGPPAALAQATGSGLVRLDRDGRVIAGAAVRWAILEDGTDYIFRIDDAAGISAATAARRLRTALKRPATDRIRALAGAIEGVQAVTATVVEMRLSAPQPDLLPLLARPELAIGAPGPMRAIRAPGAIRLIPRPGDDPRSHPIRLHVERVGRAVARFAAGRASLVLGGTFADLPVAHAARPDAGTLRFDPAAGLFGVVPVDPTGPYAAATMREALSLAIDRDRIVAAIGAPGLAKATTLAGSTIEQPLDQRRAAAITLLAGRTLPPLRIAMPSGPGAHLLFALLARDWRRIGVAATAVPYDAPADLKLIDLVAPPGMRAALACAAASGCDPADPLALLNPPYIPLAAPVRWSLVAQELDRFAENPLAAHPLDQLR